MKKIGILLLGLILTIGIYGQSLATLKTYFQTGAKPTGAQFSAMLDACYNQATSSIWSIGGTGSTTTIGAFTSGGSGRFYTGNTLPTYSAIKMNYDGAFYATALYSNGVAVLTSASKNFSDTTSSAIYKVTGNVGIGTNYPLYKLHVVGHTQIDGIEYVRDTLFVSAAASYIFGSGNQLYFRDATAGKLSLNDLKTALTSNWTLASTTLHPSSNSYVLTIGTTTPVSGYALTVSGAINATGSVVASALVGATIATTAAGSYGIVKFDGDNALTENVNSNVPTQRAVKQYVDSRWLRVGNYLYNTNDSVVIGGTTATAKFSVTGNASFTAVANYLKWPNFNISEVAAHDFKVADGITYIRLHTTGGKNIIDLTGDSLKFNGSVVTTVGSYMIGVTNSGPTYNTFLGYGAGINTTGGSNVKIGYLAGNSASAGYSNTFMGVLSGYANTSGYRNTFLGDSSGYANTSGYHNVFIGYESGCGHTTGYINTAIGYQSGYSAMTGYANTFLGAQAGNLVTSGHQNVYIGAGAGSSNTSGTTNVFVGRDAGSNNLTGSSNVFIGVSAGANETGSNKLYISNSNTTTPLLLGDFSAKTLQVNGASLLPQTLGSGKDTITGSEATKAVAGIGFVTFITNTGKTVQGFSGGVAGQILYISNLAGGGNNTIKNNGAGTQKFLGTGDIVLAQYGGCILWCDGSAWYCLAKY